MPDPAILTNLGVSGFAIWVLWMAYKLFVQRLKEKDLEHAQERNELAQGHLRDREAFLARIDKRDAAFDALNEDVRNSFATTILEATNSMREIARHIPKSRKKI